MDLPTEALDALNAALDAGERQHGDPQPPAGELLTALTCAGYTVARAELLDDTARRKRAADVLAQYADRLERAGKHRSVGPFHPQFLAGLRHAAQMLAWDYLPNNPGCQCSTFPMAGGAADCPNHVPGAVAR